MRERNSFGYRRTSTGPTYLDLGQSGLDLQTTEFIPAGAINPEIGVFLWPKSIRQTRRRELYGFLNGFTMVLFASRFREPPHE